MRLPKDLLGPLSADQQEGRPGGAQIPDSHSNVSVQGVCFPQGLHFEDWLMPMKTQNRQEVDLFPILESSVDNRSEHRCTVSERTAYHSMVGRYLGPPSVPHSCRICGLQNQICWPATVRQRLHECTHRRTTYRDLTLLAPPATPAAAFDDERIG